MLSSERFDLKILRKAYLSKLDISSFEGTDVVQLDFINYISRKMMEAVAFLCPQLLKNVIEELLKLTFFKNLEKVDSD